jgi:hypothetical protein
VVPGGLFKVLVVLVALFKGLAILVDLTAVREFEIIKVAEFMNFIRELFKVLVTLIKDPRNLSLDLFIIPEVVDSLSILITELGFNDSQH